MTSPHLLFLAMSGVRVREPELRQLGMTLPGFVERGRTIARLPSLGLLTLAGMTPPDWRVSYREIDELDEPVVQEILASDVILVAISALTARILDAYAVAHRLRVAGKTVVIGGLHASAMPEEAGQHVDSVVVGQGEAVWETLLRDFQNGALRPVYDANKQKVRFSLARAPRPRYDLLEADRYHRLTIQTTRGCPLDCEFCGASRLMSPYQRKPLPLVRRDLEFILELWHRPFLELADDNTFVTKSWSRDLARLLGEYPVRWFTETDISVANDPLLLELLAESGCAQLLIGLESAVPDSLRAIDRTDWKRRRHEDYRNAVSRIQNSGISVNGCFTLGLDNDTVDIFEQTLDFVNELQLTEVQITLLTPFPGTALYRRFEREGRLLRPRAWDQYTLFDVTYQPKRMSVSELREGFAWLMRELYNDEATSRRKHHFHALQRGRRLSLMSNDVPPHPFSVGPP